jgi:formamidopyrimidine-DNA glycosylase
MPELPEVETMRRGLLPIVGGIISSIVAPIIPYRPIKIEPSFSELRRRAVGTSVHDVVRIAKRVLVVLSSGDSIVMQPKMAGIAMLWPPPNEQHLRVVFEIENALADRFVYWDRRGLGTVCLWTPEEVDHHLGPTHLGPDASIVEEATFVQRFCNLNREVKVAMLDQKIVCGIGNLYASEILHAAKVDPRLRCNAIKKGKWKSIHTHTIRILNDAIEHEGSTLSDGTYRNAINGEGSYQNRHQVYDRQDDICFTCDKENIIRIVQGQRSTFLCPKCQR